jgi:hypothetical protein
MALMPAFAQTSSASPPGAPAVESGANAVSVVPGDATAGAEADGIAAADGNMEIDEPHRPIWSAADRIELTADRMAHASEIIDLIARSGLRVAQVLADWVGD